VQLPYLQPFDDVNKRVSRLAANIPLIKHNLIPLSFTDIPRDTYIESILAVYELNRIEPLKEVFIWAYERSVNHYQVVRQTLGEPDEFRLRYRQAFKDVIKEVIRSLLDKQQAYTHINKWMHDEIPEADQSQFLESAETELLSLHEGNFARYQIRPAEFEQWQKVWQNYKDSKA
jgi:Fic family protein